MERQHAVREARDRHGRVHALLHIKDVALRRPRCRVPSVRDKHTVKRWNPRDPKAAKQSSHNAETRPSRRERSRQKKQQTRKGGERYKQLFRPLRSDPGDE